MLFRGRKICASSENHTNHINTLCVQNVQIFKIEADGAYISHGDV
jgi:hypothetical protein